MILGNSALEPVLYIGDSPTKINDCLGILGVHFDNKLSFEIHISAISKKVYAKIGALRRIKMSVPADVALFLNKAYMLPHLEYCSPLLFGINKTLNIKLESANYYTSKILLNLRF